MYNSKERDMFREYLEVQQSTPNSTPNENISLQENILELMKEDKHITRKVMVEKLGISMNVIMQRDL